MTFRIKDISEKIKAPMSTIRYWEKEFSEFINPKKTKGGQRRYTNRDLKIFYQIKTILYDNHKSISEAKILLGQGNTNFGKTDWSRMKVLITGGTGSFGKFFCDYLLKKYKPKTIRIFSRDELKQYEMKQQINDEADTVRYLIGDIRDFTRLKRAMEGVDIVIHAAALKQVPSCEYNPFEAVKTNIIGTQNIIDAAIDVGVKKVLALSTDKAVNPINLYGATKLCAEKILISGNWYTGPRHTIFSCARYGNVIGSRGSVVPLFNKQKDQGKLTITDKEMTRFWITLEQAAEFVINSIQYMQGGEVFIPKLPSMKILDLAKAIAPECDIECIGIRPGEKLHETLITSEESANAIEFNNKYIIFSHEKQWGNLPFKTGKKLPKNFSYESNSNPEKISIKDLQAIVTSSDGETL